MDFTHNGRENEIKSGETKLKSIIGGSLIHNSDFMKLMRANHISNTEYVWKHINSQVRSELKDGTLAFEDIEPRVYELLLIECGTDSLIGLNNGPLKEEPASDKYCPKCGVVVDGDANFCGNCGFDLKSFFKNR